MRAVVLPGIRQALVVEDDFPEPTLPEGKGEVIEITACGVCHSDLHVVDGDFPSPLPLVLGHEVTGVHPELGPVLLYAPWGCGACPQCADGDEMICANSSEAGLFTNGGYCDRMWVPDRKYLAPLDGLDPITAAPLACGGLTAYRAVDHGRTTLAPMRRQGRVLLIGVGGLGQYAIRYLQLLTDAKVIALDLAEDKRSRALALGADEAIGPDEDIAPCDLIIDFIGSDVTLATAAGAVARKGLVIVVGLGGGQTNFGLGKVPPEARFMTSFWGTR
ncbi:uncharacterized protein METZ01_LOCUS292322, partial [marine metagenome]